MKRSLYLFAAGLIVLLPQTSSAQTNAATANITAGRNQLKLQTPAGLAGADSYFAKALTNSASNLEANLLKAASSLLLEQSSDQFQAQLTGFGVDIKNNNIYGNLEYVPPLDANGDIQPNSGFTTNSTLAYLNSKNTLIDAALANLGKFGSNSTSFKIFLSAEETALDYTQVDYGDVLMMRALLKGLKAIVALANSYNINAEYELLFTLGKNGELTPQKLLEVLPDLFKFADSTQRATAKTLLVSANADYQAAHTFIKNSRLFNGVPYLFEYNDISEADLYATQINGMVTSLNAGTDRTLTLLPDSSFQGGNVTLNPAAFFSSTKTLREFITSNSSAFSYGYPTRTSWPDTTFGGVIKAGASPILDALEETFNDLRFEQRLLRLRMRPARSGTIKAWGSNATGQTAVPLALSGVVQVAAGGAHSLALKSDGTLVGWGDDSSGQGSVPKTLVSTLAGSRYNHGGWGGEDGKGENASFEQPQGIAVDQYGTLYVADTMNNKIRKITPQGVVTTLAGSRDNYGGAGMGQDGTGAAASFSSPKGIAVDQYGTVFVADTMNNKIRKITPSGVVTTLAGGGMGGGAGMGQDGTGTAASFSSPQGIAVDQYGTVFVADTMNDKIRKITPAGVVTTLAGGAMAGGAGMGQDGTGTAASFSSPQGIAVDQYGTVFVADTMNDKIRKITPAGVVTTLAGGAMGGDPMGQDGIGSAASFRHPKGIAVDATGDVFVTDASSSEIRKITPSGVVTTLAGGGMGGAGMGQDGAGASASFSMPTGVAVDGSGKVYVADTMNNKIRKITSLTTVNQIAAGGTHSLGLLSDGTVIGWGKNDVNQALREDWRGTIRNAVQIAAGENHSLALREDGSVVAWGDNSKMQAPDEWDWNSPMSSLNDVVQIAAGGNHSMALRSNGTLAAWGDNTNGQTAIPAGYAIASFSNPLGVVVDGSGNVYVADDGNRKIRKITPSGNVTTLSGSGSYGSQDGTGNVASFYNPVGLALGGNGILYVADRNNNTVRKISADGEVVTLAGNAGLGGYQNGQGTMAVFDNLYSVSYMNGDIYVADSGNNRIRKISSSGLVTTLAGSGNFGYADGQGEAASFACPTGVAVDGSGNVYVADFNNARIRKITSSGLVTTLAGSGNWGYADGQGTLASFWCPHGVAVDGSGNVYVTDSKNARIRKITSSGLVTTLAGSGNLGYADGQGEAASFATPTGVTVDGSGNVYVADSNNNKIRKITPSGGVSTLAGSGDIGSVDGISSSSGLNSNRITQIAAGGAHSLALTANGTVIAWGDNSSGQTSVPNGLTNVVQIAAGAAHSMAIKADGTIVTWGSAASTPSGISNPIQASAGGGHSLVLMASGPVGAPVILSQPQSQYLYANSNATFSVTASGANLTYQWLRNGATVAGATSSTYNFVASALNAGAYTVRVSNALGNATSSAASLSIRPVEWSPVIGPSAPVQAGDSVTFEVENVTGPGTISYQWLKNGKAIAGKTSSTLTLDPVGVGDSGSYALEITTSAGKIVTESQNLVVQDSGTLVYKILATGSKMTGASKTATSLSGYFVRDRFLGDSHIVWMNAKSKKYSFETRSDITVKSTGPFAGSTSVLRAYQSEDADEEMLWLSGTDTMVSLNSSMKTLAPATLSGQINSTFAEESTLIEMLKITLTLDKVQTLKALTTDDNDATTTATRLIQEIETKGYQSE